MLSTRGRLSQAQAVQVPGRKGRLRDVINVVCAVGSSCNGDYSEMTGTKSLSTKLKRKGFLASWVVRSEPESQPCRSQNPASNWSSVAPALRQLKVHCHKRVAGPSKRPHDWTLACGATRSYIIVPLDTFVYKNERMNLVASP